jgi:hypothetical protein
MIKGSFSALPGAAQLGTSRAKSMSGLFRHLELSSWSAVAMAATIPCPCSRGSIWPGTVPKKDLDLYIGQLYFLRTRVSWHRALMLCSGTRESFVSTLCGFLGPLSTCSVYKQRPGSRAVQDEHLDALCLSSTQAARSFR